MEKSKHSSNADSTEDQRVYYYGCPQILARDMSKIVNRKLFSDVHFIVGPEREKIWGHKCILSARCSVFRQLFINEPNKSTFDLCSIKPLPFILLIYFLYTNSISFDRLNIYEVFELMHLAEEYKCDELANLAENQMGELFDPKTVFEFLPAAFQMNREQLKACALEYIEDYSFTLLVPNNTDLLILSPKAMRYVLQSDLLDLDEVRLVEVACYWAENYLSKAREHCTNKERDRARASIVRIQHSVEDSSDGSSSTLRQHATKELDDTCGHSSVLQEAYENIAYVMSALRLALIPPNELLRLEEENHVKGIIPEECFIDAWRMIALQSAQTSAEERKLHIQPRRGTLTKSQKRKSFIDGSLMTRRKKSFSAPLMETNPSRPLEP